MSGIDLLVLVGPGIGHYHPIAGLLTDLAVPGRIGITAQVHDGHPLRAKVAADGYAFIDWPRDPHLRPIERVLGVLRRRLVRDVAPWIAARGAPGAALPAVTSRAVFAFSSQLTPFSAARVDRGTAIDGMLTELRPRLVLTEGHDDWLGALCAQHHIPWARYTTGPVSPTMRGRPNMPAGFDLDPRPVVSMLEGALRAARKMRVRIVSRRVRRRARARGVHGTSDPIARFAFSAPGLDDSPGLPAHRWSYIGLSPYRADPNWRDRWRNSKRDTVLVTWGSGRVADELALLGRLMPVLVELGRTHRVVLQTGNPDIARMVESERPVGTELILAEPTDRPQYDEFARSRVVLTHGGYGTINEAVAFGAAVVVIPELVADRMETAQRVLRSGVGRSLDRYTTTTTNMQETIDALLEDHDVTRNVQRVGAELRDRSARDALVAQLAAELEEQ